MIVYIITADDIEADSPDYVFSDLDKAKAFLEEIGGNYRRLTHLIVDDQSEQRFGDEQFIHYCAFDYKLNCYKPNHGPPEPHMRTVSSTVTHKVVDGRCVRK